MGRLVSKKKILTKDFTLQECSFRAVVMSPCRQGPTTHQSCQQTPTSLSSLFSHTELHSFTFYIFLSMSPTGSDLLSQRKLILDSVFQISNLSYYLSIIDYRRLFWRRTVISQNPADIRCLSATHLWPG